MSLFLPLEVEFDVIPICHVLGLGLLIIISGAGARVSATIQNVENIHQMVKTFCICNKVKIEKTYERAFLLFKYIVMKLLI